MIHNEMPSMSKFADFMAWYDECAESFKTAIRGEDLHAAALTIKLMFSMDRWLAEHRFEA